MHLMDDTVAGPIMCMKSTMSSSVGGAPVTIYGQLLKNRKCIRAKSLINGALSSGEFSRPSANKREAVCAYFVSGYINQQG